MAGMGRGRGTGMPGVTGLVVIWFGAAVPLEVVLADMQLKKRPVCVAEPAERAGRGECAGHVVLLAPHESQPAWSADAFGVGSGWR